MAHHDPSSLFKRLFSCAALKNVVNKLLKDVSDEIKSNSTPFLEVDLKKLEETLSLISTTLPDAEQLAISSEIQDLLLKLKEVAYDIEDLLLQAATRRLEKTVLGKIDLLPGINPWKPRRAFASDLKLLLEGLDEISAKLSFSGGITTNNPVLVAEKDIIVGLEENKEQLIRCILSSSTSLQHPYVVNVTGPGGIGKTTLVQQVCQDSRVSSSFDFISQASYDGSLLYEAGLRKLTTEVDRSAKGQRSVVKRQGLSFGELEDRLCDLLQGRKFLLVVDGVKHGLLSEWKEYLALLMVGAKGSVVIVISWSSIDIRRYMVDFFRFDGISEREGWSLFKRDTAFDEDEDAEQSDSSALKDIGRSIVKKCSGSPMAVKTLASLLRHKKDIQYWEQINQSKLWGQGNKAWIAWCISLQRVPIELIPSYIVFSNRYRRYYDDWVESKKTDKLVWFWMAQGFLQSTKASDDLTDIGHRFCDELESMSFLRSYPGLDYACLLEGDFAECLAGVLRGRHANDHHLPSAREIMLSKEELLQPYDITKVSSTTQCKERTMWSSTTLTTTTTTIFHYERKPFMEGLNSNLKYLRVLFLDNCCLLALPKSIGKLKLLKYLSLSRNGALKRLTDSVCKLVNLETLDLYDCPQLKELPRNSHKLVSLRHFLLSGKLKSLPDKALGSWTSLHHLKICKCQDLASLGMSIQNLAVLRTLEIIYCPSIASLPNSINCLTTLKEFSILHCSSLKLTGWEGLCHLRNLKSLQIVGLPELFVFPTGLQYAADSLEHLGISQCENLDLTGWKGLHDLRKLKSFLIGGLPKLLELPDGLQSSAFSLEKLVISDCQNLRTLPESLKHCTNLAEISILNCYHLCALPQGIHALKDLQVLKIYRCPRLVQRCKRGTGEDWHLITHIPTIYLNQEVIRNIDADVQERAGALNFSPDNEIRPASATSPSEIIQVPEDHSSYPSVYGYPPSEGKSVPSTSEHRLFSPPTEAAAEHPHPAPTENSPPIDVQPVTRRLEKEIEGMKILFLFGEECEFEKDMLIQLWMALGLLTDEPMEVGGASFFEKLVSEGFILRSAANYLYRVNTGKLNTESDMVTDNQKYLILDNTSRNNVATTETMHVSVVCDEIDRAVFETLGRFNGLRTLLFLGNYGSRLKQVPRDLFLCYESLSALDLSGTHIKELPSSSNKMIHLRYLDLSWTFIKLLPEGIDHFKKLQTLKLKGCSHLHRLPRETKGLAELRHLDVDVLGQLAVFPKGMGALVNLRTLSAFPIGTEEGLKITELHHLNNLTGEFCIANLENVRDADEAKEASLTAKKSIKMLELRWSDYQLQQPKNEDEDEVILQNLRPHSDLEEIQILCYPGTSFAGWIAHASFHKLSSITLFRCEHVSMLPLLGNLPSLKTLKLVGLNNVTKMDLRGELDSAAFPALRKLAVDEMPNLEAWAEAQEGDYPRLTELIIKDCPKLPEVPYLFYLSSLEQLELSGCDKLAFVSEEELSSSLQQLIVEDCLLIKERCSESGGQDWHKIYRTPNIWIDQEACETFQEDSDVASDRGVLMLYDE